MPIEPEDRTQGTGSTCPYLVAVVADRLWLYAARTAVGAADTFACPPASPACGSAPPRRMWRAAAIAQV